MAIVVRLDVIMAMRKLKGQELSKNIGINEVNLSKLKTGNIKAIKFSTLDALCRELNCQPGDLLEYVEE